MIAYKEFYHCKKIPNENEEVVEYQPPVKKWGNYQPLDGYVDTLKYGESVNQRWRLMVSPHDNDYTVGDLLYLDGDKPDDTVKGYEYGDGANARVTAVKIGYKAIQVEIEQIIERND
jgi:hypothetical protein